MNISEEIAKLDRSIEAHESNIRKLKGQLYSAKKARKALAKLEEAAKAVDIPKENP